MDETGGEADFEQEITRSGVVKHITLNAEPAEKEIPMIALRAPRALRSTSFFHSCDVVDDVSITP